MQFALAFCVTLVWGGAADFRALHLQDKIEAVKTCVSALTG